MLQKLRKDYSAETTVLAKAKEQALSKTTWVDELMAEKSNQNATTKAKEPNFSGL